MKKWIIDKALSGDVVCDIGQIDDATQRELNKLVRAKTITKWRGRWYPVPGASWGLGPMKNCYGLSPTQE